MLELTSKIIKTDVTCVKYFKKYILAGIGNNLHIFSIKGDLLQIYPIFSGQKIHGIIPSSSNKIAVFGANVLKIVEFDFFKSTISKDLTVQYCKDWIFAIQWLDADTQIATIFAKNYVSLWSAIKTDIKCVTSVECEEKCTLYTATLVNNVWNNLFVLSGTVFGHIFIWKPAENLPFAPVLYRIEGHDGAIFSIAYSQIMNTIVTTSDDRTVRLWSLSNDFFTEHNNCNKIMLKHTMYGHAARVFRCKINKHFIITAGEDSFVHVWNFEGELIRKFETHQGGCVWALDYCTDDDLIITGGGDSGISLYPLKVTNQIEMLSNIENETPRSLKLTAKNNVVVIMDSGCLKYYKLEDKTWTTINKLEDLKSYAILEVCESRELIALAGLRGSIHIYKECQTGVTELCSFKSNILGRIFSISWLNENQFLTSTVEGVMNIWYLKQVENKYDIEKKHTFILPPCKERWATCAAFCFQNNIVIGDRKGSIHLYELNSEICIQSMKKVHCHLGVTSLNYINSYLFSLGRNGFLNKYSLNSSKQLIEVSNDKVSFTWLTSMLNYNGVQLLTGFSGSNFIIYNLDQRRIVLELNCGGGHRSWDIMIKSNLLYFCFIKEKRLNMFSNKYTNIVTQDLVGGYHNKEINCGEIIQNETGNFLFVSGGEDTTLRFSLVDLQLEFPKFVTIHTVKSHLSSVRCSYVCCLENNEYLIFTGGGRAQIIMHKLEIVNGDNKYQSISCHKLDSYYKQLEEDEAETRIMDIVAINFDKFILLIAGASDGTLKCYTVDLQECLVLKFVGEILYASKCIIRLSYIKIYDHHIIISMATDGKLVFWDFSNFCDNFKVNIKPFFTLQSNQSGINSVCIKNLQDGIYLFATGGDDNSVVLNVIKFIISDNLILSNFVCSWKNSKVHGAQVTGIFIHNNYFVTTSIDQYISVFKYAFENNDLKCDLLSLYCSSVSDLQGMKCTVFKHDICLIVYGKGLEVLNLKL